MDAGSVTTARTVMRPAHPVPAPPALTSREASKRSRAHAQAALTILERRAALPPAVKTPLNYAFFIDASKKWLRA